MLYIPWKQQSPSPQYQSIAICMSMRKRLTRRGCCILKLQEMLRGKLASFHRRRLVRCWFNLGYSREYLEGDDPLWRREALSYCLQILYSLSSACYLTV